MYLLYFLLWIHNPSIIFFIDLQTWNIIGQKFCWLKSTLDLFELVCTFLFYSLQIILLGQFLLFEARYCIIWEFMTNVICCCPFFDLLQLSFKCQSVFSIQLVYSILNKFDKRWMIYFFISILAILIFRPYFHIFLLYSMYKSFWENKFQKANCVTESVIKYF